MTHNTESYTGTSSRVPGRLPDEWLNRSVPDTTGLHLLYARDLQISAVDLLVFVHIPKCAGSQFMAAAMVRYRKDPVIRWFPPGTKQYPSYKASGCHPQSTMHCSFSELHTCIQAGSRRTLMREGGRALYVAMMRDPVERTISEFFWGRKNWCPQLPSDSKEYPWPNELCRLANRARNLSKPKDNSFTNQDILDWLESPFNLGHNRQTKHVAAGALAPAMVGGGQCVNMHYTRYHRLWEQRRTPLSKIDTRTDPSSVSAWQIMQQHFLFVGVQSDFYRSVRCLRRLLGISDHMWSFLFSSNKRPGADTHRSNAPRGRIPTHVRKSIAQYNKLDVSLYLKVTKKFNRECPF
ncbi:hypothetical protein CYMTET_56332 [Cymbomonas tetramitiformis]|uniref:Sulfotransferase n=1 Tax=Cymbomonas tetramitiformis TaxID=36881 RepID=A0AAE0ELY0_9CHLO|nr:hypothetical protein CYMTET_56332 [Cymbomonas tetramitiformis]